LIDGKRRGRLGIEEYRRGKEEYSMGREGYRRWIDNGKRRV
jgi:hypothetical protein